ncbi:MAG: isoprenylcysteine carboxylmethyltransferase family protein [Acidobacteriaceae bacterium]
MSASLLWEILFYGWCFSEVYIALGMRTRNSGGNTRDRGTQLLLWIVIFFSIFACEWISGSHAPTMFGGAHWLKTCGIVVFIIGLAIRWIAILSLGKSFSANVAIQPSQTIYRGGMYRWIRHPSYLGMLIIFLAIGIHSRNWLGLFVVLIPTTLALLYRIHVEEIALNSAFGEAYASYSKTTRRLLPFLY